MHYDALTLACMAHELREHLTGGRVQQVVLPDAHSIGMEVYAARVRRYLLLSVAPGGAVVYCPRQKPRRGVEKETPLLLLLRKYVRNATLSQVRQPDPTERVLWLDFDHPQQGATSLVVELIGRRANILLLGPQDRILECVRRVAGDAPGERTLLPGRIYASPAPQDKLPPFDDGREDYYAQLTEAITGLPAITELDAQSNNLRDQSPGKLWKALVDKLAGVSPSQARELAWRTTGDVDAPAATLAEAGAILPLVESLQALWGPVHSEVHHGEWTPGTVEEKGKPIGYAPYAVHFRGEFVPQPSLSVAIETTLAGAAQSSAQEAQGTVTDRYAAIGTTSGTGVDPYGGLRNQVAAQLRKARRRVERQLAALAADEPAPGAPEQLRAQAEWLLALHAQIQLGEKELAIELGADSGVSGVDEDGMLRIPLREDKTPVEQAQQMFKQAGKLSRAATIIPKRRAQLEGDLAFLDQLATDLALAENQPEIATVQQELRATRLLPPASKAGKSGPRIQPAAEPLRFLAPQGYEIVVGRNARQNERVTFKIAQSGDTWLHARGVPGAHVVIRTGGQQPDTATLTLAAQLAAYYSQARGERAAPVIVTQRKHIARAAGGHRGQVTVRQEETLTVRAELPDAVQRVEGSGVLVVDDR